MSNGWELQEMRQHHAFPQLITWFGNWACWLRERAAQFERRRARTLRLAETLSLGDRRLIAVLECGSSRFLVGVTSTAFFLLANLNREDAERRSLEEPHADEGC